MQQVQNDSGVVRVSNMSPGLDKGAGDTLKFDAETLKDANKIIKKVV